MLPILLALAQAAPATPAPSEIVAAAPAREWRRIAAEDLLVMELAPDAGGRARRVVIQLMPPPFARGWIANIRLLARQHWWDGTSVNRVQDNYVAQWGDATEKKPLPPGLITVPESGYEVDWTEFGRIDPAPLRFDPAGSRMSGEGACATDMSNPAPAGRTCDGWTRPADVYADGVLFFHGWPVASQIRPVSAGRKAWPVHCYGAVGVGRNLSPDTGTGAELYAVIGHAPRHLDRNIAVVGRVIEGIEHLSSLPRGTGPLGFYEKPEERVAIRSVRLASDLPPGERPQFEYLSTEEPSFRRYAEARANRHDAFFIRPAGGADICNVPVPVRRVGSRTP